jgi:hypothetical protein
MEYHYFFKKNITMPCTRTGISLRSIPAGEGTLESEKGEWTVDYRNRGNSCYRILPLALIGLCRYFVSFFTKDPFSLTFLWAHRTHKWVAQDMREISQAAN